MEYTIIDAHAHLWLRQDTKVNGQIIKTLKEGRSQFMGEVVQMVPPFIIDGKNTAEIFLSNMNYAQVAAAVLTQEYIDGLQNDYLWEVQNKYPDRFLSCGLIDVREQDYVEQAENLIKQGFRGIKLPANRFTFSEGRIFLNSPKMMQVFKMMEAHDVFLSIDLMDGNAQTSELKEVITEYPNLRVAIGHFGMATRPNWQDQIKLARYPNVMIESGGITWLFNDEFYPFKGAVWAIKEAASLVGMEKLMWGSDYPRTITAITYRMSYDFILKSDLLNEEEKWQFLRLNAKKFYNFENLTDLPYIKNMSE